MRLEDIGFYTLCDSRAMTANYKTRLSRCEIVLTSRCNFKCPYCRNVGGEDIPYEEAAETVRLWAKDGLKAIRFSGGEPTLYPGIFALCVLAGELGIERIAISTNGSAKQSIYDRLIACGVNDFSVSLDACCAEDGDKMAGGIKGAWVKVIKSIMYLSTKVYTTVGIVLTEDNMASVNNTVKLANASGVSDIRIIPAAQNGPWFKNIAIDNDLLDKYPILRYRVGNMKVGIPVRGLTDKDSRRCGLVLDDMAVNGGKHYPCIIYMRESGNAIGEVGEAMRLKRKVWSEIHDTHNDPICKKNCLDVCISYNNRYEYFHRTL